MNETIMEPEAPASSLLDAFVTDTCHLRIPSLPDLIAPTVELLVARAQQTGVIPSSRATRLMMALHEALSNSVIHGNLGISSALKEQDEQEFFRALSNRMADPVYAGRIVDIHAAYSEGTATWTLSDQGAGFDVDAALRRLDTDEPDLLRPSGRGMVMIRAFTDEMRYEDRGRRLILQLRRTDEKRTHPRWRLHGSVHVTPMTAAGDVDHAAGQQVAACNISASGIAFIQGDTAPSGHVMITIPTTGEPINLPAEVRHYKPLDEEIIEVGCRFMPEDPSESVSAIDQFVARMADELRPVLERRTAPRLPYTERISIQVKGQPVVFGFARDLSRSGVAFLTTTNLPLEVVSIILPAGATGSAIQVPARVVRCTRLVEAIHDVAVQFLE